MVAISVGFGVRTVTMNVFAHNDTHPYRQLNEVAWGVYQVLWSPSAPSLQRDSPVKMSGCVSDHLERLCGCITEFYY